MLFRSARSLGGERAAALRTRLAAELERLQLPEFPPSEQPGATEDPPDPFRGPDVSPPPEQADSAAGTPTSDAGPDERRRSRNATGGLLNPSAHAPEADLPAALDARLDQIDGYLCEIKEAQIRVGLHRYGSLPEPEALAELLVCLARPPQAGLCGITQALARDLGLDLDPWADPEERPLAADDRQILEVLPGWDPACRTDEPSAPPSDGAAPPALRCCGDGIARLEAWALSLMRSELEAHPACSSSSLPAATDAQIGRAHV